MFSMMEWSMRQKRDGFRDVRMGMSQNAQKANINIAQAGVARLTEALLHLRNRTRRTKPIGRKLV